MKVIATICVTVCSGRTHLIFAMLWLLKPNQFIISLPLSQKGEQDGFCAVIFLTTSVAPCPVVSSWYYWPLISTKPAREHKQTDCCDDGISIETAN